MQPAPDVDTEEHTGGLLLVQKVFRSNLHSGGPSELQRKRAYTHGTAAT
jgi:hypothetical protein